MTLDIDLNSFKIKRENATLNSFDIEYFKLVNRIFKEGKLRDNRTGISAKRVTRVHMDFDLSKSFPICETKKLAVKNCTSEIQWIHQVQSNDVRWLHERGNKTWDEWMIDEDGVYRTYEQGSNITTFDPEKIVEIVDLDGKILPVKAKSLIDGKNITSAKFFGKEYAYTIGEAYGFINSITHSPQDVEYSLKNNPTNRRMIINLWQDEHLKKAVLPSCVWSSEYTVTNDGALDVMVVQRSADVPLGLPFNITQYAILASMFAKASNLKPGVLDWSIADAHIYENQLEGMQRQLKRYRYMLEYSKYIQDLSNSDDDIKEKYDAKLDNCYYMIELAESKLDMKFDENKPDKFLKKIKEYDEDLYKSFIDIYEEVVAFHHMLTRENPKLVLADHNSIFDFSTEYSNDKEYLKENPTGNKDIIIKGYTRTPEIKYPIAQ